MRRAVKILLITAATLTLAATTLSTHIGQSSLLRLVAAISSSADNTIEIGELKGSLFGEASISEVRLSDRHGSWLVARGISFAWSPSQLFAGRLSVAHLRIDSVSVERKPESETDAKERAGTVDLPIPLKIALGDFGVKTLDLSGLLAGEQNRLRITGSTNIDDTSSSNARLRVTRLDGPEGQLDADIAFDPKKRSLDVEIIGHEADRGLVAQLLELPSREALSIVLQGHGTLATWKADLSLAAGGNPFVAGSIRLDAPRDGKHRLSAHLVGFVEHLLPKATAVLFPGKTAAEITADFSGLSDGVLRSISDARIAIIGDAMRIGASGAADLENNYVYGKIEGRAVRNDGSPLTFSDREGKPVSIQEITFQASLPEIRDSRQISAAARLSGVASQNFSAETLTFDAGASQPQPAGVKAVVLDDIRVNMAATGVDQTSALGQAVGEEPSATASGAFDGKRLSIDTLTVLTEGAKAKLAGAIEGNDITGTVHVRLSDLARYAPIADRPLKGQAMFTATLAGNGGRQTLTASISGESTSVGLGIDAIDRLLAPLTRYRGIIELGGDGTLSARQTSVANDRLSVLLNASRAADSLALTGNLTISSLAAVNPDLSGKATLDMHVSGSEENLASELVVAGQDVKLNGKPVDELALRFAGLGPLSRHVGNLAMAASLSGEELSGKATLVFSDTGATTIDDILFDAAGTKLGGKIAFENAILPSGQIRFGSSNLARLGNAIGVRLKGSIQADAILLADTRGSVAKLNIAADDIAFGDWRVASVRSAGSISDYLKAPVGSVGLNIVDVKRNSQTIGGLSLQARFNGDVTTFISKGGIAKGAFELSGNARSADQAYEIQLISASYSGRSDLPAVRLSAPALISLRDGDITTKSIPITIGNGRLRIAGSASTDAFDLKLALDQIPASIVAVAAPGIGMEGGISGSATFKGKPSNPEIVAKIAGAGISLADTRSMQLPAADIITDVRAEDGKAQLNVRATARGGTDLSMSGTVGIKNETLTLTGRGTVPLSLANIALADRAARVEGSAALSAKISGRFVDPQIDGRVLVAGATLNDYDIGLELTNIDADLAVSQNKVTVVKFGALSKKGGSISAHGIVQLPREGPPAMDASLKLAALKFGNQDPVAGEIDGDVKVSGPLQALVAQGDILIKRMDITVPNGMPQSISSLNIRHVNAAPRFQTGNHTEMESSDETAARTGVALALNVRAEDRIFVRGRGLDAQLGGLIKIRGTANKPLTDGQFKMSRGKLSIIGRQLDFSHGNIIFRGSPEPTLDMEAKADADGTIVTINVSGPASKPTFQFTSSPELPEDEIVSLLLFNKTLAKLSPAQVVQLAGEVDKIGGLSKGPGTLDKMKSAMGIDVLDFTTDEQGEAQAAAGSYINDKTYIGVKQGMSLGKSRIAVDHDLPKNLKARGEVGADGDSKLGLGFEWDY